jgi:hypothetical protein
MIKDNNNIGEKMKSVEEIFGIENNNQYKFTENIGIIVIALAQNRCSESDFNTLFKHVNYIAVPSEDKDIEYDIEATAQLRQKYIKRVNNLKIKVNDLGKCPDHIYYTDEGLAMFHPYIQNEEVSVGKEKKFDINDFD